MLLATFHSLTVRHFTLLKIPHTYGIEQRDICYGNSEILVRNLAGAQLEAFSLLARVHGIGSFVHAIRGESTPQAHPSMNSLNYNNGLLVRKAHRCNVV